MTETVTTATQTAVKAAPQIIFHEYPQELERKLSLPATKDDIAAIFTFAMRDKAEINPILKTPELVSVAQLGFMLQNVRRKVSGEPYFKHVMRTAVLVSGEDILSSLSEADSRVLCAAAYLHDAIELQRKARESYGADSLLEDVVQCGLKPEEAERAVGLVSLVTPDREGQEIHSEADYFRYKIGDLRKKYTYNFPDGHLLRLLKAADTLANMEETVEDIRMGRDDSNMHRPLPVRLKVFQSKIKIIKTYDPENPFIEGLERVYGELVQASAHLLKQSGNEH